MAANKAAVTGLRQGASYGPAAPHPSPKRRAVAVAPTFKEVPLPAWLRAVLLVQRFSVITTFALVLFVFVMYGWTVYTQTQWNSRYRQLDELERKARQLTAANETIDNDLAESIQRHPGALVRESPSQAIFIEAAPLQPAPQPVMPASEASSPPASPPPLLGY